MELNSDPGVALEAEHDYDDDVFYAEIRRQILLLTTEEDEDLPERKCLNSVSVANGGKRRPVYGFSGGSPPRRCLCLWESEKFGSPAPVWLVNLWKNGKGTGVFIPQVQCSRSQTPGTGTCHFQWIER